MRNAKCVQQLLPHAASKLGHPVVIQQNANVQISAAINFGETCGDGIIESVALHSTERFLILPISQQMVVFLYQNTVQLLIQSRLRDLR